MTTVIIITVLVLFSVGLVTFLRWKDKQREKQPSEPVEDNKPTTEPEKPVEPKFKVGDYVVGDYGSGRIVEITDDAYLLDTGIGLFFTNNSIRLWDITKDAKDGDVLAYKDEIFIYFGLYKTLCYHCCYNENFITDSFYSFPTLEFSYIHPATKEQCDLLFAKMAEAGYVWLSHNKKLVKLKFKVGDSVCKKSDGQIYYIDNITENGYFNGVTPLFPIELQDDFELVGISEPAPEPVGTEEPTPEETFERNLDELLSYFSQVVPIGEKTKNYILNLEAPTIDKDCFPVIYDYFGTQDNKLAGAQGWAWVVGLILSELVPEKREELMVLAYNFMIKGKDQPTYGFAFNSDPNIMRMTAAVIYAVNRDASIIPELRKEVGGKMLTYKNDISECYIDTTKFMPTAPPPFIKGYEKRPKGLPVDATPTADMDEEIHNYISQYYSLDTKDAEKRQATIQAISNKEYHKQHLFGKPRTVTDKKYGTMTFVPVYGVANIGVEIPDNGDIANFVYEFGKVCSATRITLLDQEYGRRRPGQGEKDGSANADAKQRALVNYAIEEGDGHTTGYYDKGGYYVDGNGNYIGDYETYYQGQLFSNSYPSGHSAFIEGVGMMLLMVMPDKADIILKATNEFAISRCICRYHWMSDTIHGRIIGSTMIPVLAATTNTNFDALLNKAKAEYERIKNGTPDPSPVPSDEKVNTSLAYSIGGYGSCHVDAGEKQMVHRCTKQCTKERHPAIQVNQRVEFTIEGGGVTDDNGKTSGVWEANKAYGIKCPKVNEDVIATITMRNENGVKVLEYRCSKEGSHDDGAGEY